MRSAPVLLALGLLMAGCESTKVGMMDGEESCTNDNGKTFVKCETGAVAVLNDETGEDIAILDQAFSRSGAKKRRASIKNVSPDKLQARYGGLFGTMPKRPRLYVLYFNFGSDDLVDGSDEIINELFREVEGRPGVDVQIVGHTDTMGASDGENGNDALSEKRAELVKAILERRGLKGEVAYATGRGEREPIDEPTRDEFASALNRRVEVFVK